MRKNQHRACCGYYLALLLGGNALNAQPVVPATHAARLIAGDNGVGAHFELLAGCNGSYTGFFILKMSVGFTLAAARAAAATQPA